MHKFLFYNNKFSIFLYMFRAPLCSPTGGQNCIILQPVSSHSVDGRPLCGRPVHRSVMLLDAVSYNFDLLMMSTVVLETCRGIY